MASDVSLAFNAVGRDRGVNALLTRTSSNVRAANLASAASTAVLAGAWASAGATAIALASSAMAAAGAVGAVPAALAAGAAGVGAYRAVTFGLADAWKATGQAAVGGGGKAAKAGQQAASAARAVRDAEWSVADAKRGEERATRALADAQRDAQRATAAVNKARAEEKDRLEDLSRTLAGSRLDEEAATRAVAKAAQDLAVARAGGSNYDIEEADLAYRQAQQTLEETTDRTKELGEEQEEGSRKGVEGSDAVQEALQRQADSQQQVKDAEEGLAEAHRQSQRAAEQLADAHKKVETAAAGAASGGIDPAAAALAKLSPNGRAVILMLRQLAPAWQAAARAGQQATFAGVAGDLRDLSSIYLPRAQSWLVRMGGSFNTAIRESMGLFKTKSVIKDVDTFLGNTALSTDRLARAVRPVINGFVQWIAVGSNFLPGLAGNALTIAQRFERWSIEMRKSGQAASWIGRGIATLRQFGAIARDVTMSVVAIFRAGDDGGSTVTTLAKGAAAMRKWLESAEGQAKVAAVLKTLRNILTSVGAVALSVAGHGDELGDSITVFGKAASFAVDHLGPLVKYLPTLAAGYLLLKHTGIAAGVTLGVKVFQIASQFAMSRAIKAHTAALRENTLASRTSAAAGAQDTAAQNGGVLARGRAAIATVAQKVALVATTVATRAAAAGQWLLNAAMSANPLGLIIIAIIAVGAALYLLWTKSTTFRKIVIGVWNAVWGAIKAVWNWIRTTFPKVTGFVTGAFSRAWSSVKQVWTNIKSSATSAKDWVVARFVSLTSWFSNLPSRIGKTLGKLGSFLMAPFRAAFNGVANLWNNTIGSLSFTVPSWVPGIGGGSFSLPRIPQLAQGALVRARSGGTLVNVGEGGEDEAVVPLSKMGQVGGGGGGRLDVHLTFDSREFKRLLRAEIRTGGLLEGIRLSSSAAA